MRVLVTGAAGFVGFHVSNALLARGDYVVGIDNMNGYYDPVLKETRLALLTRWERFSMIRGDIADGSTIASAFEMLPDRVIHLAAQPGVRYSITNPRAYIDSNIAGTLSVLEACRHSGTEHLVYASSSSVYGANTTMPYSVHDNVDHPVSLYAATKKSTELMAHAYSHLYRIPTTGLRFFTVYGPWGRPDMAPSLFADAILHGRRIDVFNEGQMLRDFTYIDDIVRGVIRVLDRVAQPNPEWSGRSPDPASSSAPYRLYNIGNSQPVKLLDFIQAIQEAMGLTAELNLLPLQPGDVVATCAEVGDLQRDVDFAPSTSLEVGVGEFVNWYRFYHDL